MAKKKDTWVDRCGNAYVVIIMAVPGLALCSCSRP